MTTNITQRSRVVIRPRTPVYVSVERTYLSPRGADFDRTYESSVILYLVEDEQDRRIVQMAGGPTGREAFELTPENVERLQTRSWVASVGVRGRIDRIVVPAHQLGRFFAHHGVQTVRAAA